MQSLIFLFFIGYIALLFLITWLTSRKATNDTYFTGNRKSPWFIVAYGMIGASLSGVTFMSVPGDVVNTQFSYVCVLIGYILGYLSIAYILLPLYYKYNLTSIYQFLDTRFGNEAQKTGSTFFIISRLMGSALRMYLVIYVLQIFIFDSWNIPIWATAIFMIVIITLYTFRGGLKTVVWTDTLQTTFLVLALIISIVVILKDTQLSIVQSFELMKDAGYTRVFNTDWHAGSFYLKQILGGMFITITMTGLDQDMMQKNLSCKTLKESQFNMLTFTGILIVVNMLFLFLGGLLLIYAQKQGIALPLNEAGKIVSDRIYPELALNYLGMTTAIFFVLGLIAAGFSSADGTFTALTTSFCFDILKIEKHIADEKKRTHIRYASHALMSALFLLIIIIFSNHHNEALIQTIFKVAGYTYGPILGLFVFGMFTQREIRHRGWIAISSIVTPTSIAILAANSQEWLNGYTFGFELVIVNGLMMFLLLLADSKRINLVNNL